MEPVVRFRRIASRGGQQTTFGIGFPAFHTLGTAGRRMPPQGGEKNLTQCSNASDPAGRMSAQGGEKSSGRHMDERTGLPPIPTRPGFLNCRCRSRQCAGWADRRYGSAVPPTPGTARGWPPVRVSCPAMLCASNSSSPAACALSKRRSAILSACSTAPSRDAGKSSKTSA